jgi:hypothetical protein
MTATMGDRRHRGRCRVVTVVGRGATPKALTRMDALRDHQPNPSHGFKSVSRLQIHLTAFKSTSRPTNPPHRSQIHLTRINRAHPNQSRTKSIDLLGRREAMDEEDEEDAERAAGEGGEEWERGGGAGGGGAAEDVAEGGGVEGGVER